MSQEQLAVLAGTTQQHISLIERGKTGVELKTVEAVLHALGCQLAVSVLPAVTREQMEARQGQWRRFAEFESGSQDPSTPAGRLSQIGELVDLYRSLHGAQLPQPDALRQEAGRSAEWRRRLASVRPV